MRLLKTTIWIQRVDGIVQKYHTTPHRAASRGLIPRIVGTRKVWSIPHPPPKVPPRPIEAPPRPPKAPPTIQTRPFTIVSVRVRMDVQYRLRKEDYSIWIGILHGHGLSETEIFEAAKLANPGWVAFGLKGRAEVWLTDSELDSILLPESPLDRGDFATWWMNLIQPQFLRRDR